MFFTLIRFFFFYVVNFLFCGFSAHQAAYMQEKHMLEFYVSSNDSLKNRIYYSLLNKNPVLI